MENYDKKIIKKRKILLTENNLVHVRKESKKVLARVRYVLQTQGTHILYSYELCAQGYLSYL